MNAVTNFSRLSFWCAVCLVCLCPLAATALEPRETILLVDDAPILYRPATRRVLHSAKRHAQTPMIAQTKPWEVAIGYCSVYRDPATGHYQMWYQAYAAELAKEPGKKVVICYATSEDGLNWVKPNLGLFSFNDEEETNIVMHGNGGRSVLYCCAVAVDPRTKDPAKKYKMAYWDFMKDDGVEYPGVCIAFSPDGVRWTKHPEGPVLRGSYGDVLPPPLDTEREVRKWERPGSISDVVDLMWDPIREKHVLYTKTWIDGPDGNMFWKRAVVRTESSDFVNWSRPQLVVVPDEFERAQLGTAEDVQIHGGPVFYHAGVYFALLQILDLTGIGIMPTELALSRDGIDFERPFRDPYFFPVTGNGKKFDDGCLWTNAMPIIDDDEMRFYYGAYAGWNSDYNDTSSGVGLSVLPRDRFAGIRPLAEIGQVTLKPHSLDGVDRLTLNADAAEGTVRVELLTEDGYRVPGFTKDDAVPITSDGLREPLAWKEKSLADLPQGSYRMRIHLKNAEVFAVDLMRD